VQRTFLISIVNVEHNYLEEERLRLYCKSKISKIEQSNMISKEIGEGNTILLDIDTLTNRYVEVGKTLY